jgi:hypothetical protein
MLYRKHDVHSYTGQERRPIAEVITVTTCTVLSNQDNKKTTVTMRADKCPQMSSQTKGIMSKVAL